MKTEYDTYGNGVALWKEILTDGSNVYYVRMYGRDLDTSFVEFACEGYTNATYLAQELVRTTGTKINLEVGDI